MTAEMARQLRADVPLVLAHVAGDANGDYLIHHRRPTILRILMHSLPRFGCGEVMTDTHLDNLAKVVGWVCFQTRWDRKYRQLTPDELRVEDAAWRLSDALHAARASG